MNSNQCKRKRTKKARGLRLRSWWSGRFARLKHANGRIIELLCGGRLDLELELDLKLRGAWGSLGEGNG